MTVFWQQGLFASFTGIAGINIHYALFIHPDDTTPSLVLVPGRSESYLKYQELAFDLYQKGFNIFIIDHRGQGLSERLIANKHKGYVVKFQHYIDDLKYFIDHIVAKNSTSKPYILAHSMGGAIATRFMQDSPDSVRAAVIASPMLGFNSGSIPSPIATGLIKIKLTLNRMFSVHPWYFIGQQGFSTVSFSKNKLTHSAPRYQNFSDLYQQNKSIQLGGVTCHWLAQSIGAQKEIFAKINQLKTPILVLQAGKDTVVCQQAQNKFCQQLHALQPQSCPDGVPIRFDDAYHELFFEIDDYRDIAIQRSLAWFKQHS